MGKLHKKVTTVLQEAFVDLIDGLEEQGERISGYVASSVFDKLDDAARQKKLWNALETGLTEAELRNVGPIATLGQAESAFPFS